MKNLEIPTENTEASFTKRILETDEITSAMKCMIEEMDTSVKYNIKSKNLLTSNS